eukprot:9952367-Alexandrium_andersonii.AAC.1
MAARRASRIKPVFSCTTRAWRSGRKRAPMLATAGTTQKRTEVGPHRPSQPCPAPAVVSC